ncbi:hypothetical protein DXA59_01240 [Clostridium sp. OF03-18AA]|nr:hypothetical protein DXA59_01240 [Clostridium sp. OF03-18AA]
MAPNKVVPQVYDSLSLNEVQGWAFLIKRFPDLLNLKCQSFMKAGNRIGEKMHRGMQKRIVSRETFVYDKSYVTEERKAIV